MKTTVLNSFDLTSFLKDLSRQYESVALIKKRNKQEMAFAESIISSNAVLYEHCTLNPSQLRQVLLRAAALGVSLSPADKEAFLRVDSNQLILGITYQGLKSIAQSSGVLTLVVAENVYSNDTFVFRGPMNEPIHEYQPLSGQSRGEFRGVFCTAYLTNGMKMVEYINAEKIEKIRKLSPSPLYWEEWFEDMTKKSVIKQAYKSWPKQSRAVIANAIHYLNTVANEGVEFDSPLPVDESVEDSMTENEFELFKTQNATFIETILQRARNSGLWETAYSHFCERVSSEKCRQHFRGLLDQEQKLAANAA